MPHRAERTGSLGVHFSVLLVHPLMIYLVQSLNSCPVLEDALVAHVPLHASFVASNIPGPGLVLMYSAPAAYGLCMGVRSKGTASATCWNEPPQTLVLSLCLPFPLLGLHLFVNSL